MKKTDIKELQSVLKRMGYGDLAIDGIIGPDTQEAIMRFKIKNGLPKDNVLDLATYHAIFAALEASFPTVDIVPTDVDYTYKIMLRNIIELKSVYPFIGVESIGNSTLGRKLYCLKIGTGTKKLIYVATHHSLEWINTVLMMKFVENFCKAYQNGRDISGYDATQIYQDTTLYIIPMLNPDGVSLVLDGIQTDNPNYENLIECNKGSTNFANDWQANNHGVDLNHNYDAGFYEYVDVVKNTAYATCGPTRYPGPAPFSESESRALADFTSTIDFRLILTYHSTGEVIYWKYRDIVVEGAEAIGEQLAEVSGYTLSQEEGFASFSGYKDYIIEKYRKPAYTVETGIGKNPLPISKFDSIYEPNLPLLLLATTL